MNDEYQERIVAIRQYLEGDSAAQIYRALGRSPTWFFKWKNRYERDGLEGLRALSKAPKHQAKQTPEAMEAAIVQMRTLRERRERDETKYALIGAFAIHKELCELGYTPPSSRTVHRILVRHGFIGHAPEESSVREIIDRHYPALTITAPGMLHQLDLVGPRYLKGSGQTYYFYNLRDVCSRKIALEVGTNRQAKSVVDALVLSWQRMGLPTILQHDNALEFRGRNRYPRSAGLVTKLCLALGIEPVFIPSRQPWRNGTIENFNGLFQSRVLESQAIENEEQLRQEVRTFEEVANTQHPHIPLAGKTSQEYERAVQYSPQLLSPEFSFRSQFHFTERPNGKVSFICRIRKSGRITIASEKFEVAPELAWEYVYATIFVKEQRLKIYHQGCVIKEWPYELHI
ncbi:MAG: DDE-type integrase/transposase/recombinase [Chitinivibrionales bacterium]|nr:DDE-type integrase/transposase/recombinase [Chitinivibrionales bacterium]